MANHSSSNKHKHAANRLAQETSPYLLMHAHNPVDWFPWGEEALAKARKEDKPIFLSIGYSSCYWCHVMERESFLDEEIAEYLNEHFVSIKVDREERPDLDDLYMTSVQLLTRQGGWPMSVFLTPEQKPFFGGTYYPPRQTAQHSSPGFLELLNRLQDAWKTNRPTIQESSDHLTEAVQMQLGKPSDQEPPALDKEFVERAGGVLARDFDPVVGGFGYVPNNPRVPKFPEPTKLEFLLYLANLGEAEAEGMLIKTLDHMARGGIYDHLGGGFHRYSTDRFWWVPHFEKMLCSYADCHFNRPFITASHWKFALKFILRPN